MLKFEHKMPEVFTSLSIPQIYFVNNIIKKINIL